MLNLNQFTGKLISDLNFFFWNKYYHISYCEPIFQKKKMNHFSIFPILIIDNVDFLMRYEDSSKLLD
jgi:hypothetical protein